MTDLYLTKKDILVHWAKHRQLFSAVDIEDEARNIGILSSTARRYIRDLTEKGIFKRISHDEKIRKGLLKKGNKEIAWYSHSNQTETQKETQDSLF